MKKPCDWCSVSAAISALGGRWKPLILHELSVGTLRFNELLRVSPARPTRCLPATFAS